MKAILIFAMDIEKWVIDVETDDGQKIPVGKTINEEIGLFEISKWNTRSEAEDWVKSKGLDLK